MKTNFYSKRVWLNPSSSHSCSYVSYFIGNSKDVPGKITSLKFMDCLNFIDIHASNKNELNNIKRIHVFLTDCLNKSIELGAFTNKLVLSYKKYSVEYHLTYTFGNSPKGYNGVFSIRKFGTSTNVLIERRYLCFHNNNEWSKNPFMTKIKKINKTIKLFIDLTEKSNFGTIF